MTEEPKKIGIRDFKQNASEYLRQVREERATYTITHRGKAIAELRPAAKSRPLDQTEIDRLNAEMDAIAHEVAKKWPKGLSAVDAVREQRR
jgi:prevent-host-death family protein